MDAIDGGYLRKLRKERGLSLRAFAQKIYVSKSTVQRWEQSRVPADGENMARIAGALGMTADEFIEGGRNHAASGGALAAPSADDIEREVKAEFGLKGMKAVFLFVAAALFFVAVLLPLLFV